MSSTALEAWREELSPIIARLDFFVPNDFAADFSTASLDALERAMMDNLPPGAGPGGDFAESAMAYVGEALLRAGGGRWDWDEQAQAPLVRPDDALGIAPISPLRLIIRALRERTGREFSAEHAALVAEVAKHPGWSPAKEPTPGVDQVQGAGGMSPWLTDWLAGRAAAFPAWAADAGGGWDFTESTVGRLRPLLRRRLPAPSALADPAYENFVQGAVWYLGEVGRRNHPGAYWRYSPAVPGSTDIRESYERNPYVGRPFVGLSGPDGEPLIPIIAFELALADDDEDWIQVNYDRMGTANSPRSRSV